MSEPDRPYVAALIPPDPARDARVAARRAADARRAGVALDRLLGASSTRAYPRSELERMCAASYVSGWNDGCVASQDDYSE